MWFDCEVEVIPAVDVLGVEAVRLRHGRYDRVVERSPDPLVVAARWIDAGARRLHLVDLDGARRGGVRPQLVARMAELGVPVQASGGIRSLDDARALLDAGAERVVVGTAAWPDPEPWLALGDAVVLAVDVRRGEVRVGGWTAGTGIRVADALARTGGARVLLTAIERDGTLQGPDVALVRSAAASGARILAAGGIRSPADVDALAGAGAEAAIVGRALFATVAAAS